MKIVIDDVGVKNVEVEFHGDKNGLYSNLNKVLTKHEWEDCGNQLLDIWKNVDSDDMVIFQVPHNGQQKLMVLDNPMKSHDEIKQGVIETALINLVKTVLDQEGKKINLQTTKELLENTDYMIIFVNKSLENNLASND